MSFGCLSNLLRASFLTLALPLLLVGSLLSEVSRQLHLQSVNHLRYAIGEETASAGLQVAAEESAAGAVEQQTEALEFEAEAARLQQMSAEDMQAAIERREAKAGMEVDEGAEEAAEGTEQLSATVDAAAEAAAGDVAVGDAATGTAATSAAGAAGEVVEATAEAAGSATAAAAEGTAATAEGLTAGEAAAVAGGEATAEATAAEAGGALGGPVGLAVAGAGVAAAIEAPKVVAAAQGLSAEVQADKDEVLAVEREAQVEALETDSVVEEGGAVMAHDAAWTSMAAASGYFVSGQLVQAAAFAFEIPIALVVFSQWIFGALAPVLGILCGCCETSGALLKSSDDNPVVRQGGSVLVSLTLTAAIGSLLLSPWAETVAFAAKLEAQDPTLAAIESLPQLFQEALEKYEKNEKHRNAEKDDQLHITRRLWPNLTEMQDAIKEGTERTEKAAQGALQVSEKAVQGAAGAVAGVMPENVKKAASVAEEVGKEAANATVNAAETAAEKLKEKAIRLKNGNPDVRTTTVAPRARRESPNANHGTMLLQAFSKVLQCVWSWVLPVLRCIAFTSFVLAFTEFGIAAGRHYPAVRTGSAGRHVILGRMLHDVYSQWVWGVALLIAVWVLSIILATSLRGPAEWVRSQLQTLAWPFFCVQLLLCIVCLVACFSLARKLSQLEESTDEAGKLAEASKGTSSDEEKRLLESECGSQVSTTNATECETGKVQPRFDFHMASSMAASGICFIICGVLDALLSAMENPVSAWALGASWKSLFMVRFLARLLPWSWVAPTILGYKLTSPYELLVPIVAASFIAGGLLVFLRRRSV